MSFRFFNKLKTVTIFFFFLSSLIIKEEICIETQKYLGSFREVTYRRVEQIEGNIHVPCRNIVKKHIIKKKEKKIGKLQKFMKL